MSATLTAARRSPAARTAEPDLPEGGLPLRPTGAPRGSFKKVETMRRRVARGERPCHPFDSPAWARPAERWAAVLRALCRQAAG
jgi:hypothetical protein